MRYRLAPTLLVSTFWLVAMTCLVMWVRSYWILDGLNISASGNLSTINSSAGRLHVRYFPRMSRAGFHANWDSTSQNSDTNLNDWSYKPFRNASSKTSTDLYFFGVEYAYYGFTSVSVPFSFLFALALGIPLFHIHRLLGARRRLAAGLCPVCGYDLRAHAPGTRCPECGIASPTPIKYHSH